MAQEEPEGIVELVISVADQKMAVLRDGELLAKYEVSTSKFGVGDTRNSYKTPLGRLRVCEKVGDSLPPGAVLKGREETGEILPVNAPGRDPIVTRILWLEGTESQNQNARGRGIYIHGTPEEKNIGEPVSWGCVRMRSRDVIALYDTVPVAAAVSIYATRLPRYKRWTPRAPIILARREPAPAIATPVRAAATPAPARIASVPPPARIAELEPPPVERPAALSTRVRVVTTSPAPAPPRFASAATAARPLTASITVPSWSTAATSSASTVNMVEAMGSSILLSGLKPAGQ